MSIAYVYNKNTLRKLLQIKAEMAADPDLAPDFDMCITVKAPGDTVGDEEESPFWQYGFAQEYNEFMEVGGPLMYMTKCRN